MTASVFIENPLLEDIKRFIFNKVNANFSHPKILSRTAKTIIAKQMFCYVARHKFGEDISFAEIGYYVSLDHATAMHHNKIMADRIKFNETCKGIDIRILFNEVINEFFVNKYNYHVGTSLTDGVRRYFIIKMYNFVVNPKFKIHKEIKIDHSVLMRKANNLFKLIKQCKSGIVDIDNFPKFI